ncbi:hypothetical protein ES703_93417 [subsurface metagenome]
MALGNIVKVINDQGFAVHLLRNCVCCARNKNIAVLLTDDLETGHPRARAIAIDNAGLIDATPEGSLVLHDQNMSDPGLIHYYEDVFIAITQDDSGFVRLLSFLVSDAGVIPANRADLLQIETASSINFISDLLRVHDHVLLTGESYPAPTKHVETVICSFLGIFEDPAEDSLVFSDRPRQQRFRHGSGNRIVAAFSAAYHINIASFTCTASGTVPATPTDTWDSFTSATEHLSLCKVTDLVYAIFTLDVGGNAVIRTFSIKTDGDINKSFLATKTVEAAQTDPAFMYEIGGGYFIVAYGVSGIPGRLRTYHISDDGTTITGPTGSLDITSNTFNKVSICHLAGDIWAMAFNGSATEILLYTLEIETPTEAVPHHEMLIGMGP